MPLLVTTCQGSAEAPSFWTVPLSLAPYLVSDCDNPFNKKLLPVASMQGLWGDRENSFSRSRLDVHEALLHPRRTPASSTP